MFTTIDKALIALVMSVLSIINLVWGIEWFGGRAEEVVGVVLLLLTPVLVYLFPNLPIRR